MLERIQASTSAFCWPYRVTEQSSSSSLKGPGTLLPLKICSVEMKSMRLPFSRQTLAISIAESQLTRCVPTGSLSQLAVVALAAVWKSTSKSRDEKYLETSSGLE